jgi:hypothetical protein
MSTDTLTIALNRREDEINALKNTWALLIPAFCPEDHQFALWLELHGSQTVLHGIRETAKKYARLNGEMTPDHALRFASKCMNVRACDSSSKAGFQKTLGV